jgi:hypothetical protein
MQDVRATADGTVLLCAAGLINEGLVGFAAKSAVIDDGSCHW